jgi:hypothetical protein
MGAMKRAKPKVRKANRMTDLRTHVHLLNLVRIVNFSFSLGSLAKFGNCLPLFAIRGLVDLCKPPPPPRRDQAIR